MSIFRDPATQLIYAQCDTCNLVIEVADSKGRLPADWGTGQLWVDLSLGEQRQTPLCWCPACFPAIAAPGFDPRVTSQGA